MLISEDTIKETLKEEISGDIFALSRHTGPLVLIQLQKIFNVTRDTLSNNRNIQKNFICLFTVRGSCPHNPLCCL